MMSTLESWFKTQTSQRLNIYLVLDSADNMDARNELINELGQERFRNLYSATAAQAMESVAPYIFQINSLQNPAIQSLIKSPEQNWGWLASSEITELDVLAEHIKARLITGERPNQAIYRYYDNRVFARALAFIGVEDYPAYLGPLKSVCYWQADWAVVVNTSPAEYPVPASAAWLNIPAKPEVTEALQFDNARRFLVTEHSTDLAVLAEHKDVDAWLKSQIEFGRIWGWSEPEHMYFLLTQNLRLKDYTFPESWHPRPNEQPGQHFKRLFEEAQFWDGEGNLA